MLGQIEIKEKAKTLLDLGNEYHEKGFDKKGRKTRDRGNTELKKLKAISAHLWDGYRVTIRLFMPSLVKTIQSG